MTDFPLSRRALIVALCALSIPVGVEELRLLSDEKAELIRSVLERLIGPFDIADAQFAQFVRDYLENGTMPSGVEVGVLNAAETVGATRALSTIDEGLRKKLEIFERSLLTGFALGTGIEGIPGDQSLTYLGLFETRVCANPFARFD